MLRQRSVLLFLLIVNLCPTPFKQSNSFTKSYSIITNFIQLNRKADYKFCSQLFYYFSLKPEEIAKIAKEGKGSMPKGVFKGTDEELKKLSTK
jgi:hypothetical protein